MTAPSLLVAVDPGVHGCGVAVFVDGVLGHAEYCGGLGDQIHPLLEPVERLEALLIDVSGGNRTIDLVAIECPQVYDAPKQVGRQSDLIRLAVVVGAVLAIARPWCKAALLLQPAEWKGQVKKEVMEQRIRERLAPEELGAVEDLELKTIAHNVIDAIGIGLVRCGRMGK